MNRLTIVVAFLCVSAVNAAAQTPVANAPGSPPGAPGSPSYSKHIHSFLAKYCIECHNPQKAGGRLELQSYQALIEGGLSGPAFVPGRPDESLVVRLTEGKDRPIMPPREAKAKPKPEEIALLRSWVAAGAKDDGVAATAKIPDVKPTVPVQPSITALAYHPKGQFLAAAGQREVVLIELAKNEVVAKLPGQGAKVTTLAFSKDGNYLAVASGEPGQTGIVRIYFVPSSGIPSSRAEQIIKAHKDSIFDVVFSPDGQTLATCSYDRLIKLWKLDDPSSPSSPRELKDHSDAVYGLAFSPDGKLLASVAADRAAKVWDVASGKRLYTLSEATDWLYAVAWSPDGQRLAAAGVDKSIRVWTVNASGGEIAHSVFAHEGPVTRLVYAADGKTLYSLSEDRTVKAWDTAKMVEKRVYAKQPDTTLALAVRRDQKQLALGRFDGVLALLDEATGKPQSEPLPVKPKPPALTKVSVSALLRGQKTRVHFEGKLLENVSEIVLLQGQQAAPLQVQLLPNGVKPSAVEAELTVEPKVPPGAYQLALKSPAGQSAALPVFVDWFPAIDEKEGNDSPTTGQPITLPATIVGALQKAGDVDFYRFEAKSGQHVGVQVILPSTSKFDPVLTLTDTKGRVLAESTDGVLGHACGSAGFYAVGIRDREYRGEGTMTYRLHVGHIPVITGVFPLGLQRGREVEVRVSGVNLEGQYRSTVKADANAQPGTKVPVTVTVSRGAAVGSRTLVVGELPEVDRPLGLQPSSVDELPVPGTLNGELSILFRSTDTWSFKAKKGQPLLLETHARRLGSPIDTYIEILDAKGNLLPRATLRALAKTYVTFRDHDSAGGAIRIEAWSELGINDWIWVNNELLRIKELPTHPDADCNFWTAGGQRIGYLDTTPTQLAMGAPMYKVEIHPPGTTFPPNGYPVFNIYWRNDDGGPGYGKDSRLIFDPPADGEYLVRVGSSQSAPGASSPSASGSPYRLTIRPPRPSFNVSFNPTTPSVPKGGAATITVNVERIDGFAGRIDLKLENLPPGFSAPETHIPAGENSTAFALYASNEATVPANAPPLKLVAKAAESGRLAPRGESTSRSEVTTMGGVPKLVDAGDIVTATVESEITVEPGKEARLTVKIERKNGFAGRVPIEVKGLPHGVKVADIGLNGILITEKETVRTMRIYCYPWVEPLEHPLVVLAKREGKNTEHAAKSVLLKVVKPAGKAAAQ